ncbi:MAG: hypothetical protein KatS3mg105_0524 [Gemmatales bacterium]|nr:MAG: hypothetical protein KatS3mg105_0524 [Gemmatales bacterium]
MFRSARCFSFVVLLVGTIWVVEAAESQQDPLPIRRIVISREQAADILSEGSWLQLPYKDFQRRLDNARQAKTLLENPPRLLEARYRAKLVGNDLVGTVELGGPPLEWRFSNPHDKAAIVTVEPFNLAVEGINMSPSDAIVGDLAGKKLAVLIRNKGSQTVEMEWSARGSPSPGVIRFDLRIPEAPIGTLELHLPPNFIVVDRETFLLSGPFPAKEGKRWRIDFSGQSQLDLEIREAGAGDRKPLVLAQVQSRQQIEPDLVRAAFHFEVEVPHQGVDEFRFQCDPGLVPYEVSARNLLSWEVRPGNRPNQPAILVARLKKPFQGTLPLSLDINCLASSAGDRSWRCPGIRLLDALHRGENLVLEIHPDVRLEEWDFGSFDLDLSESGVRKAEPGWQVLRLIDRGIHEGARKRPHARVNMKPLSFRTEQKIWWQIAHQSSQLAAVIRYEVVQGQLFRLPVSIPSGWEIERFELTPGDLLLRSSMARQGNEKTLLVDLQRPLTATADSKSTGQAELRIWYKSTIWAEPAPNLKLPFPLITTRGARIRRTVFGLTVDPYFQVKVDAATAPVISEEAGPWGKAVPDLVYVFRGTPAVGAVELQPRQTQLASRCHSRVLVTASGAEIVSTLLLRPRVGKPQSIDLTLSAPGEGRWSWKTLRGGNQVIAARRLRLQEQLPKLLLIGSQSPLISSIQLATPASRVERWRLRLAEPLGKPLYLQATCSFQAKVIDRPPANMNLQWNIPLLSVAAADPMHGEVTLQFEGVDAVLMHAVGVVETPRGENDRPTWRRFRYGQGDVGLSFVGRPAENQQLAGGAPIVTRGRLTSAVDPAGRLLHTFEFVIADWKQSEFTVVLPPGSRCLGVQVENSWANQLDSIKRPDGNLEVVIPMAGAGSSRCRLYYEQPIPSWRLWTHVVAEAPKLPVRILDFERAWRLPPGVRPLDDDSYIRQPGPLYSESFHLWQQGQRVTELGLAQFHKQAINLLQAGAGDWAELQRHLLTGACARLNEEIRPRGPSSLGESLERVVIDQLQGELEIVIDSVAFEQAGLTPMTRLPRIDDNQKHEDNQKEMVYRPWHAVGIAYVPCRSAALLTTNRQLLAWRLASGTDSPISPSLEAAIQQAVDFGRDDTGRFQSSAMWLGRRHASRPTPLELDRLNLGVNWESWRPLQSERESVSIHIVDQQGVAIVGAALTLLLLWIAWFLRRYERVWRRGFLFAWLGLAGFGLIWLPTSLHGLALFPAIAGSVVALAVYLHSATAAPRTAAIASGLMALVVASVSTSPAQVQPTKIYPVFLYPSAKNASDPVHVLCSPELISQLDRLAKQQATSLQGAILLSAAYANGKVKDGYAEFDATFKAYCFTKGAPLTLALDGVFKEPVFVDGGEAEFVPLPDKKKGIVFKNLSEGEHELKVTFRVAVRAQGDERSVQFQIPELVQSSLQFTAPASAQALHLVSGRGRQTILSSGPNQPQTLHAELGRLPTVHLRWRHSDQNRRAMLNVREAYLWQIGRAVNSLVAVYEYEVSQGAADTIELNVPAILEVLSVEGRAFDIKSATAPRVNHWSLRGNVLRVGFEQPATGRFRLVVEFVPKNPFGPNVVLPLPMPRNADTGDGMLAYRTTGGIRAELIESERITKLKDLRSFTSAWTNAGLADPGSALPAYTFRRAGGPPFIRLQLSSPTPSIDCSLEIDWAVGQTQADLAATARLRAVTGSFLFIECDLPATLQDVDIIGQQVRSWSRNRSRLQIWLNEPQRQATIQITGWLRLASRKRKGGVEKVIQLEPLRVLGVQNQKTVLHVGSANSAYELVPARTKNLLPITDKHSQHVWHYEAKQPDYAAEFVMSAVAERASIAILSLVEIIDQSIAFHASIDIKIFRGVRTAFVQLSDWEGEVRVEAPGVVSFRERRVNSGRRFWLLTFPEGAVGEYRIRLIGRSPLTEPAISSMPDVTVRVPGHQRRYVAIAGRELQSEVIRHLRVVENPAEELRLWPAEAERIRRAGRAWRIENDDWRLQLIPQTMPVAKPFETLSAEHVASVLDDGSCLFESNYLLYHDSGADLRLNLPKGSLLIDLRVDGVKVPAMYSGANELWLPFPRLGGARSLRVRWYREGAKGRQAEPDLKPPKLSGATSALESWTVYAPPGFLVVPRSGRPHSFAAQTYRRAEAQLSLSIRLAQAASMEEDRRQAQLTSTQERFFRYCRQLEHEAVKQPMWMNRLRELKDRNHQAARELSFEPILRNAELRALTFRIDNHLLDPSIAGMFYGKPTYWLAPQIGEFPHLQMRSVHEGEIYRRAHCSLGVAGLLLVAVVLPWFGRALRWFYFFWPEEMVLLGIAGWQVLGPGWSWVFLVLVGILGRLFVVVVWLLHLFRRWGLKSTVASA